MFEKIYRFLRGTISFNAYEGFQELFLNECKKEKIALTDVVLDQTKINANIRYGDYDKLLHAAGKSGMVLGDVQKYGLPAFLRKHKKRIGIPVGLLLASVILVTLSSILWSIEVTGLKTINLQEFSAYLEKNGVKTGSFTTTINCNEIESLIQGYGENILDTTVNLVGCKMFISVRERETGAAVKEEKQYCNIIAAKDGEILKADVFAGQCLVKPGDAVLKGDLLASGLTHTPGGEPYCVEAKARILARTIFSVSCQTAERININRIAEVKNKYHLLLFSLTLPRQPERVSSAEYLSTDTGVFPLGLIRSARTKMEQQFMELTSQESFLISVTDLAVTAAQRLYGMHISGCSIRIENGAQICVDAQFYCEEDIAEQEYFTLWNDT